MLLSPWYNYHHGNISPVLGIWMFLGVLGLLITLYNLRDTIMDADAIITLPEGTGFERKNELLMLAKAGIRNEVLRLIKMLAVIISGLIAASSTPTLTDAQRAQLHIPYWTPTGVAIVAMLLLIVGVTTLQGYLDLKTRHKLYSRGKNGM